MIVRNKPNLSNVFQSAQDNIMYGLDCASIGKITKFNKTNQTVDVLVMNRRNYNGTDFGNAFLSEIPLMIYGIENTHITLPDLTGTICIVLTFDRDIDAFMETGESYQPITTRCHNITDSIAIPTFRTLNNPITEYDDLALSVIYNKVIEEVQYFSHLKNYGNYIEIKSKSIEKDENDEEIIKYNILNVNPESTLIESSSGAQIEVDDKINIENTAQSLATLVQNFLTACENIATVADESGGTLTPSSKQAFMDLKTQFGGLLK